MRWENVFSQEVPTIRIVEVSNLPVVASDDSDWHGWVGDDSSDASRRGGICKQTIIGLFEGSKQTLSKVEVENGRARFQIHNVSKWIRVGGQHLEYSFLFSCW